MIHLRRFALICGLLLVSPVLAQASELPAVKSPTLDLDNPPMGVFSDEWYVLMLNGQKCGHMHTTMQRHEGPGFDLIRTGTKMAMEVGRAESRISITFEQSTEETLAGEPISFSHRMVMGRIPLVTKGKIANGQVTITKSQFGLTTSREVYRLPSGAIMSWGTYREQIKRGLRTGLKYELSIYEPSVCVDELTPTTMEVFEQEALDLFGRKLRAFRTQQTANVKGTSVDTTSWITPGGDIVKLQMSVPPIDVPFEVIACSKTVALAANDPAELMVNTLIRAGRKLDRQAQSITYRLVGKGKGEISIPETAMQEVISNADGAVILKLTRRSAREELAARAGHASSRPTAETEDLEPYLQATTDLNFKDEVVADLARKAAGDEKDPVKLTEKLCRFVHDYVETKNLNVGFATASEVARSREGDCTEHGVLLAALGRAVGIPTRIVTGIVYTEEFAGKKNVFVGHLWTQFWIAGEWIDVDAAFGQTDVDPTHITLGTSAAGDTGMADLVASGWMSLGKIALSVVDPD